MPVARALEVDGDGENSTRLGPESLLDQLTATWLKNISRICEKACPQGNEAGDEGARPLASACVYINVCRYPSCTYICACIGIYTHTYTHYFSYVSVCMSIPIKETIILDSVV